MSGRGTATKENHASFRINACDREKECANSLSCARNIPKDREDAWCILPALQKHASSVAELPLCEAPHA